MQQKLHCKGSGSFLLERNGRACGASVLSSDSPSRCPRCGNKRFCSLAHLEYWHSSCPPEELTTGFSITGKPPDPLTSAAIPWHDTSPPAYRGQQSTQRGTLAHSLSDSGDYSFAPASGRRRTQSVGVGTRVETEPDDARQEEGEKREGSMDKGCFSPLWLPFSPADRPLDSNLDLNVVGKSNYDKIWAEAASGRAGVCLKTTISPFQSRLPSPGWRQRRPRPLCTGSWPESFGLPMAPCNSSWYG